jgi:hypothetical protein
MRVEGGCTCPHCGDSRCAKKPAGALAAALLLGLAGCDGGAAVGGEAEYGVTLVDADQDGFYEGEDCDDSDPAVNPDAEETAGDGVDSNCDGEDDT